MIGFETFGILYLSDRTRSWSDYLPGFWTNPAEPLKQRVFPLDVTPGSVAPRGMDTLEVDAEALKEGEVRVRYQDFVASTAEKKVL